MIELVNVKKSFVDFKLKNIFIAPKQRTILSNISIKIENNKAYILQGKNGSGKTTLLKLIAGLLKPDDGTIETDKDYISSYVSTSERSFFWRLTVLENLTFFNNLNKNENVQKEMIYEHLNKYGLSKYSNIEFMKLSSGQKRKVSIIRALLKDPDLYLFDEVSNSLDKESKEDLMQFVNEALIINQKKTIIWATHDSQEEKIINGEIIKINKGFIQQ
tara:strand:+ start:1718 stop:2368 length:651 start_codon:yes stop_codon:yes gene_type:complete